LIQFNYLKAFYLLLIHLLSYLIPVLLLAMHAFL